jgi:hypothetical protein
VKGADVQTTASINEASMWLVGAGSVEDTAQTLNLSPQSVVRGWKLGKAWLRGKWEPTTQTPQMQPDDPAHTRQSSVRDTVH